MRHLVRSLNAGVAIAIALAAPASAHDTLEEEANKKIVLDFYSALNAADAAGTTKTQIKGIVEKFVSPEYIQHAAAFENVSGPGSARDKLIRIFQAMPSMPMKAPLPTTIAIMAEGDKVMMLTSRSGMGSGGAKPMYIFNMFRVKNSRLVEHWDLSPSMGSPGGGAGDPQGGMPQRMMAPPGGAPPQN